MIKKKFKSIDGLFEHTLDYLKLKKINYLNFRRISLIGKGNSISSLPYNKETTLVDLSIKKKIQLNYKNKTISVSGNMNVYEIHNYLIKKNFFSQVFLHIHLLLLEHV